LRIPDIQDFSEYLKSTIEYFMTAYNHFKDYKLSKVENSGIDTSSAIDVFYLNYLRSLVIFSGA
jgi:inorganic pyrophosphatase